MRTLFQYDSGQCVQDGLTDVAESEPAQLSLVAQLGQDIVELVDVGVGSVRWLREQNGTD